MNITPEHEVVSQIASQQFSAAYEVFRGEIRFGKMRGDYAKDVVELTHDRGRHHGSKSGLESNPPVRPERLIMFNVGYDNRFPRAQGASAGTLIVCGDLVESIEE